MEPPGPPTGPQSGPFPAPAGAPRVASPGDSAPPADINGRGPAIASGPVHQSDLSRAHVCHGGPVLARYCARARTGCHDRLSTVIIGGVEINGGNRVGW